MAKQPSRPKRWADAIAKARVAYDELASAIEELKGLQEEYEEWKDNLPDNLQSSPIAEKLDTIGQIDFDVLDSVETAIDEAEGAELPQGFGRD